MRFFVLFLLFGAVLAEKLQKPNVLLIVVDDLKPALGCYGDKNAHTPNIDRLAKKSFVFQNTFAQQALCAPSRNSFLTSRRPDTLHFAGNFTTLPQHFKENGYHTKSIGKIFHPGISSNFTDDFPYSWSEPAFHPKTEQFKNSAVCVGKNGKFAKNLICPVIVEGQPLGTLPDIESVEEAKLFLKGYNKTKPYFLAVGFHKPHIPLKFPIEYLNFHPLDKISLPKNRWRPSLLPLVTWNPWNDIRKREDMELLNISYPFGPMPDEVIKEVIQGYNAATTYIDDLIGDLLKYVPNNIIIVLTSDHGWSRGEHGEFSKFSNFQEATRVPLIINLPNNKYQVTVQALTELVDLFPTLVDLTKVSDPLKKCPEQQTQIKLCTEGRSFANLLNPENPNVYKKSAIFTQYPRPGSYPTKNPDSDRPHLKDIQIMGYSIRTERFRYSEWIRFYQNFSVNWNKVYGKELYDLSFDPQENLNLAGREGLELVEKVLQKKLQLGWRYV